MATDSMHDVGAEAPTTTEAPTTEFIAGAGSVCPNCRAPLASDQRYCLNCGERRGRPRFPAAALAAPSAAAVTSERRVLHRPRVSSAATLVAGVATLLIAMGVGVLIGHDSSAPATQKSAGVQIVTVAGGGTGTSASNPAASAQSNAPAKAGKKTKAPKTVVVRFTPKVAKKAAAAAAKVFGNNAANLSPNVTQQLGAPCSGGAGCQNGKFTGNAFPGQ